MIKFLQSFCKIRQIKKTIVIAPILTHIFNQSINTCFLPDDLKGAIISPLLKSGSKTD